LTARKLPDLVTSPSQLREHSGLNNTREKVPADVATELACLRQQVEELRQAVRARDDFIAIAGHELRNPMTPILGTAELALAAARKAEGSCPPRITLLLERMHDFVQNYVKRATRLLEVNRIEAGNLKLEPTITDLSALVLSVARRYDITAHRTHCRLDLDIQPGIVAFCDRLAVEQIVENLLSNALKFGRGKPVIVRLRSNGQSASLDVQDCGIGMPPEQQARIFGRFEQVVSQHRGGGFGIGLWVAYRLATAMHGGIAVYSSVGAGSTFTVTLPLAPPAPDQSAHDPA
jgi:signal transduction histidine kinase